MCWCPPAAQTTSYLSSHRSTRVLTGLRMPDRRDPPITWPVAARTKSGSARLTAAKPWPAAILAVFTRCAPLVRISSGSPSALKIRLFAIAPTSQPICAAAAAAVGAGSGSSLTSPAAPRDRSVAATCSALGCMPVRYRPASIRAEPISPATPGRSGWE